MISCVFEDGGTGKLRHVVMHAIVIKDNKILLEKRAAGLLDGGKWSLPSGFLNRDETAQQGILRELKEETGWEGEIVSLFRVITNPNRPHEDRQNVALEFIIKPLVQTGAADNESSKIAWVSLDELIPFTEFAFDHGETIEHYLNYRKKPFALPLIS